MVLWQSACSVRLFATMSKILFQCMITVPQCVHGVCAHNYGVLGFMPAAWEAISKLCRMCLSCSNPTTSAISWRLTGDLCTMWSIYKNPWHPYPYNSESCRMHM